MPAGRVSFFKLQIHITPHDLNLFQGQNIISLSGKGHGFKVRAAIKAERLCRDKLAFFEILSIIVRPGGRNAKTAFNCGSV